MRAVLTESVSAHRRINLESPGVDAAAKRLGILKTLLAQPCGNVQRTHAMVAEDDEPVTGTEFLRSANGHLCHGHQQTALDVGGRELPGFADVDESRFVFADERCGIGRGDFIVQHPFSLASALALCAGAALDGQAS